MAVAEENPLLEGLELARTPEPCSLVIFGASGDLTKRKLFPALYSLAFRRLLPEHFAVVGVARTQMTDEEFKARMEEAVREFGRDDFRQDVWDTFAGGIRYVATEFSSDEGEDYVARCLRGLDEDEGTRGNRVFYLITDEHIRRVLSDMVDHVAESVPDLEA